MDLRQSLSSAFATRYPLEAAAALETQPPEEIARVLQGLSPETAAAVLRRIPPGISARSVELLDADVMAGILVNFGTDDALPLLRQLSPEVRDAIIQTMPAEQAKALRTVISFPPGTAGALMDPRTVALPMDMEADEALKAIRRDAEHVRYHLYVINRERRLVGVLNMQELMLARPKDRLETIMQEAHHRLSPSADRYTIAKHPGWRDVRSLPVVDLSECFLGAIHYHVLIAIEDELYQRDAEPGDTTTRALGELFVAGIGGVIDALTSAAPLPRRLLTQRSAAQFSGESRSVLSSNGQKRRSGAEE